MRLEGLGQLKNPKQVDCFKLGTGHLNAHI
jgi:hypothetical protein